MTGRSRSLKLGDFSGVFPASFDFPDGGRGESLRGLGVAEAGGERNVNKCGTGEAAPSTAATGCGRLAGLGDSERLLPPDLAPPLPDGGRPNELLLELVELRPHDLGRMDSM